MNRCPRGLTCAPDKPCPLGREARDAARDGKEAGCQMFVADREANYCAYKLLEIEGRPLSPAKVARLAMIDEKEINTIIAKFKKLATTMMGES